MDTADAPLGVDPVYVDFREHLHFDWRRTRAGQVDLFPAVISLAVLVLSGLYMFILPYAAGLRGERRARA